MVEKQWPIETRIDVVAKYLTLGNKAQVSRATGVPYETIRTWMRMPWWKELEAEIKSARRIQTDVKLQRMVDKGLALLKDRLANGNPKLTATGEIKYVPVSALEANKIVNDLMQRQADLEKISLAEVQQQNTQTVQDTLKILAQEFAKFNGKRPPSNDIVDVEVREMEHTDALHEGWQEGLQEGEQTLQFPAGDSEATRGTEQGTQDNGESGEGS
jgi:hypothetical protein